MKMIKRIAVCMLAVVLLAANVLSVGAVTQPPEIKGAVISIATRAWSSLAYEYLERAVLRGMGEVANAAGDSTFGKLVSTTKKLLGNPTATAVGEVKELCTEILAELAVIEEKIDTCNARLEVLLDKFAYEDYEEAHKAIVSFKNRYTAVYTTYDTLVQTLNTYADDPTDSHLTAVKTAYAAVEAFYTDNTGAISSDHTEMEFNFTTDLASFLEIISPYAYGQSFTEDTQPSDSTAWGTPATTDPTYIDLVHTYMATSYPYEHEIYEGVMYAVNEVAATAALYLNTHRVFTEVGAQIINSDATLDEATRTQELNTLWDAYNRNSFRLMRGIEQMTAIAHGYTATLMRPYDMNAVINMQTDNPWTGQLFFYQIVDTDGVNIVPYSLSAEKTLGGLRYYQVKSPSSDTMYAILQNAEANGWDSELTNADLVDVVFESLGATYTGVSGDFMNLRDSENPNGFRMLESASELMGLINVEGYTDHLYSFLSTHVYTEAADGTRVVLLPAAPAESASFDEDALRDGMMIPLYDDIINFEPTQITERDQIIEMVNATQPLTTEDLSRNQTEMDTEDDIRDDGQNHNNALVILKADAPAFTVGVSATSGGTVQLLDDSGTSVAGGALTAGTPLTVRVKPDDGKTVTAVNLKLANGSTVSLVGAALGSSGTTVEEALMSAQVDEDGCYVFKLPVPYQNATISVSFAEPDPTLTTYTARIQEATDGDAQFDSNNGILEKAVHGDETVSIHIRPFTGKIIDTVTVTDTAGNALTVTDATADELVYTPTSKVYTFTMAHDDVVIDVTYKDGYTVDLSTQNAGDGCTAAYRFDTANLYDDSWLTSTLTLDEGAVVTINATCTNSYYVDEFLLTNIATSGAVVGTISGNSITFTMPASSVSAKVVFREVTVGDYYASLTVNGAGEAHFDEGYPVNAIKHHYEVGETVTLALTTEKAFEPILTVTDISGNTVEVTADTTREGYYTFVMPAANVNVTAQFAEEVELRMVEDTSSRDALFFSNSTNTDKLTTAWSGEKVYFYEPYRPLTERAIRILSITAEDYDGNPIEVFEESDGRYYVIPATENVKIMASCVLEQYLTIDPSAADVFAVTEIDSCFPGETAFFKLINTDYTVSELKVLDSAGRELPFTETLSGVYEVTLGYADAIVYATVDNRQEVTYTFKNSQKFSYGLQGLMLDIGGGLGYALPGTEMCLVIYNNSSYPIAKYSETHWVKDADGNEIELRYKSGGTTSYYYFTMPDGPVTVYGESNYHSGIYEPMPIPLENGSEFTSGTLKFKVTDDATHPPKVTLIGTTDESATHITLATGVVYEGVAYQITAVDIEALKAHPALLTVSFGGEILVIRNTASPVTGDSTHAAAYALVALGALSLVLLAVYRRKQHL